MYEQRQLIVVLLSPKLLRRARSLIAQEDGPYADLNEFMEVAVETQLNLSSWPGDERGRGLEPVSIGWPQPEPQSLVSSRFLVHSSAHDVQTVPEPAPSDALFVLTNRLAPIAFGVRVLVNAVATEGGPVRLGPFLTDTARAAREVGMLLRAEDREVGRVATERRWIGWPVGADESKAMERFKWSFLLTERSGKGAGPMVDLGLADVVDGRVVPTTVGKTLALQPSPLLGETTGWTLGAAQVTAFVAAIRRNPAELNEISLFARLVRDSGGRQPVVDRDLRTEHAGWSPARAVAHRAAILGRLKDLGLADVRGSGASAVITVAAADLRGLVEGVEVDETTA